MIGAKSLVPLLDLLDRDSLYMNSIGAEALRVFARQNPDLKQHCVDALHHKLLDYENNDISLNATLIFNLAWMGARKSLDLIKQAYAAGVVDEEDFVYEEIIEYFPD